MKRTVTLTMAVALCFTALLTMAVARTVQAAEPVVPGNPNPPVETIIRTHPGTDAAFEAQPDDSARHIQSGFVCPASLPNVNLWNFFVFPSPQGIGTDVGCDYGRMHRTPTGFAAESKFTIFVVKARSGMTLEQVFQGYLAEMHGSAPGGRVRGPAVSLQKARLQSADGSNVALPMVLSEADDFVMAGRQYVSEVVVGLFGDWIVELRSTYPSEFAPGDPAAGIDFPASSIVWATVMREFAARAAGSKQ